MRSNLQALLEDLEKERTKDEDIKIKREKRSQLKLEEVPTSFHTYFYNLQQKINDKLQDPNISEDEKEKLEKFLKRLKELSYMLKEGCKELKNKSIACIATGTSLTGTITSTANSSSENAT